MGSWEQPQQWQKPREVAPTFYVQIKNEYHLLNEATIMGSNHGECSDKDVMMVKEEKRLLYLS